MPRKPKSDEEKLLEQQVRDLIKNIKGSDEPSVDIPRAIRLFESAQNNISKALAILRGEEVENPSGVGRPRKQEEDAVDSDAPNKTLKSTANKRGSKLKGAATAVANA